MPRVSRKNKTRKKSRSTHKSCRRRLDVLWRKYVLDRDKSQCSYPGCQKQATQAHHVFGRRITACRFDPDNGIAFCPGHHLYFAHQYYEQVRDLVIRRIGQERFDVLKRKAYQHSVHFDELDIEKIERELQ